MTQAPSRSARSALLGTRPERPLGLLEHQAGVAPVAVHRQLPELVQERPDHLDLEDARLDHEHRVPARVAVAEQGDRGPVGVGQVVRGQDDAAGGGDVLPARPLEPDQRPQPRVQDDLREQPPASRVTPLAAGLRLIRDIPRAHSVSLLVQVLWCRGRINHMTDNALITWSVLMPVKVLAQAKSRLAGLAGPRRGELALALAGDTVATVLACDQAARVIVITDDQVAG